MKTIEETRRELFEAWAVTFWPGARFHYRRDALPKTDPLYGTYVESCLFDAWLGFNAALDAVCIELPNADGFDCPSFAAPAINDCRAAIESTNLGLRLK